MPVWDSSLYLQFGRERTQAAVDLVARIQLENPENIVDLGCGPGNSTAILGNRWPKAGITGIDSSPEMIAQAIASDTNINWVIGNISDWRPEKPVDLIFSNAAYQWLPDHQSLFTSLVTHLKPRGVFAAQMPFHHASPLQQVVLKVSQEGAWDERMTHARNALTYQSTGFYYDVLRSLCTSLDLWETEYIHEMENAQAIVEFIKGSGLRPFVETLDTPEEIIHFESLVLDGYTQAYPAQTNGRVLFPFRRQFIVATK